MTPSSRELTKRFVATGCALLLGAACSSDDANFFEGNGGTAGGGTGGAIAGAAIAGTFGTSAGTGTGGVSGSSGAANAGSGGDIDAIGGELGSAGDAAGSAGADPVAGTGGTAGTVTTAGAGGAPVGGIPPLGGKAGNFGKAGSAGSGGMGVCIPLLESCDGLDNDCDGVADEGAACPTGCEGALIEGRSYMFCLEQARAVSGARTRCAEEGMHLVWIESASENAAILLTIQNSELEVERAWIGASDASDEGEWAWTSTAVDPGTPFWSGLSAEEGGVPVMGRYTNWGLERPNNGTSTTGEDCATLSVDRTEVEPGTWNDDVCSETWPFICEKP